MTEDELAALAVALDLMTPSVTAQMPQPPISRWKLAARRPDLEMEDLRALH
jgi:hypothetical protein